MGRADVAELAIGRVSVILGRLLAVNAAAVLGLLVAVAGAALHLGQLLRVWNFFNVAVAIGALESGVGGCLQSGSIEAGRNSRFPLAGSRTGVVATGAIVRMQLRDLLCREAARDHDRDHGDAGWIHTQNVWHRSTVWLCEAPN